MGRSSEPINDDWQCFPLTALLIHLARWCGRRWWSLAVACWSFVFPFPVSLLLTNTRTHLNKTEKIHSFSPFRVFHFDPQVVRRFRLRSRLRLSRLTSSQILNGFVLSFYTRNFGSVPEHSSRLFTEIVAGRNLHRRQKSHFVARA